MHYLRCENLPNNGQKQLKWYNFFGLNNYSLFSLIKSIHCFDMKPHSILIKQNDIDNQLFIFHWPTVITLIVNTIRCNLLHAEVSFMIDIACHWTIFSNITSFNYFLECQNPDFFHFPTPNFRFLVPSNLCSSMSGLDNSVKTHYQPIFRHCLGEHCLKAFFDVNNKCYRHAGETVSSW